MDIKNCHQVLVHRLQGLIDISFCYLGSVGKCNEAYQTNHSLEIGKCSENIRYSVHCRNPLIHLGWGWGAHGGCHGPHY